MVRSKKASMAVGLVFLFTACVFVFRLDPPAFAKEKAPKETIKTVTLKKEPIGVNPSTLKVKLGTTIVWFNNDKGPVTIKFIDKLGIACKVPVNFYADLMGYYETKPIPEGGTASICFIYDGEYDYEVKRLITDEKGVQMEQISSAKIISVE